MLTASIENLTQGLEEIKPLLPCHYLKLALNQGEVPLDPQFDVYLERDARGDDPESGITTAGPGSFPLPPPVRFHKAIKSCIHVCSQSPLDKFTRGLVIWGNPCCAFISCLRAWFLSMPLVMWFVLALTMTIQRRGHVPSLSGSIGCWYNIALQPRGFAA